MFEPTTFQPVHEWIDMAQTPGVDIRTGANYALHRYGGSVVFADTTSRSPTSVRSKQPTTRSIRICRWIRTTLLYVLEAGWRRGQEDDRELERRRRRHSHLCESSFYLPCLYARLPRGRRPVYSLPPSRHSSQSLSRISNQVPRIFQRSTSQTFSKSSPIRMAPRSLSPPHFPIRPFHSPHQPLPYGSTRSGFSACSSVSHAPFWPHYCNNGRVGT